MGDRVEPVTYIALLLIQRPLMKILLRSLPKKLIEYAQMIYEKYEKHKKGVIFTNEDKDAYDNANHMSLMCEREL